MWHTFILDSSAVIGSLLLLIGGHEWGHFWVARRLGVKTRRFAIGFGKILWRWHGKDGTEYAIGCLPLGGYVQFLDQREAPVPPDELPYAFDQQSLYKRAAIVLAGPAANFLLALLAWWLMFLLGITQPVATIGAIVPHSAAAQAELQRGDTLLAVNQQATPTWGAVILALFPALGESRQFALHTQQATDPKIAVHTLSLRHWQLTDNLRPNLLTSIGIIPWQPAKGQPWPAAQLRTRQYAFFPALGQAGREVWQYSRLNGQVVVKLFRGDLSLKALMGPVGLFRTTALAAQQGLSIWLAVLGFLSVSLAMVNLLPIPGLDGSHLCYFLLERIRGKPITLATQVLLFRLGTIALAVLMVQIVMNDLLRWVSFS